MTTTLGLVTDEGVVLAADRRVSAGESFIASKTGKKIHMIDDNIGISIAGLVSDAQDLIDRLRAEFRLYKFERGYHISLEAAAQLTAKIFHGNYRQGRPIYAQIIVAGYDKEKKKPHLYLLDPSGALLPDDKFISTGSGSQVSYGVLESIFEEGLSKKKAIKLAVKALSAAIERNPHTGDGIDVAVVNKDGYKILSEEEKNAYLKEDN